MYGFNKHNGVVTEGYLGNAEDFNGIVFLLKEPNNSEDADVFWFRNLLKEPECYKNSTKTEKMVFTRFKNRFTEMIDFVCNDKELQDAVFCNINPVLGGDTETPKVNEFIKDGKVEEMLKFFCTLKADITVFTCKNIYRHLLETDNIPDKIQKPGLTYKNGNLGCFQCEINNTKITVYEIIHPSRSSAIINK